MKKLRGVFERVPGSEVWWICYFDAAGKKRREKAGTRGNAVDLYRKRKTEVLQGKKLPEKLRAKAVPFSVLADDALEHSRAHKLSHKHDTYRMTKLKADFNDRPAEALSPLDIERWIASHEDWKPATCNRYRALLSLVYRLGIQNGKVAVNPARLVRHRRESNGRIRWLLPEEETKLRKVIESQYSIHLQELEVALNTGLRRSEQYSLTWECVDLERKLLMIPRTKNGETRYVPLNSAALNALQDLRTRSDGTGRVFMSPQGARLSGPRQWFGRAVQAAGVKDFTWHCLRHTFASRLVMAGVDLRTVQELMGHKTISMTCRYAHLAPSHKLAAVERLTESTSSLKRPTDTRTDTSTEQEPNATAFATL